MKEELIRILNNKLDDINSDIDSLVELNENIKNEEDKLSYVSGILDLFKDNVMNFSSLSKSDFNKVLDILDNDVRDTFSSASCNYDGLVYLINGINDGISLALTDEQKNGIEYLIQKLGEKKEEHKAAIEGFNLVKNRYLINDVEKLKSKKESYLTVLDELDNNKYVNNTDILMESLRFSELTDEESINILKYLLEYNAEVYENGTDQENNEIPPIGSFAEVPEDYSKEEKEEEPTYEEPINDFELPQDDYQEFHFNDIVKDEFTNYEPLSFDNDEEKSEDTPDDFENDEVPNDDYVPLVDKEFENNEKKEVSEITFSQNDFHEEDSDEKISTNDLHLLLGKYDIKEDNTYINELVVGDVVNYEKVLNTLKENNLIERFKNNSELLIETLLYSDSEAISKVLEIIKDDLSVDNDDCVITTRIVIDTIPSVFISQGGNYNNFIENIKTFKELDLNLINLFDFSKELFVASHDTIANNLEIVKKYDITITYENAKYLLLLPNIGDRIDYYVESVYDVKVPSDNGVKTETFDGINYINNFTAKLNVVTDETIKRLRYVVENEGKVFGSKEGSLSGEITNLKVNTLDLTGDYLNKFFNNEFAILTGDEVREYIKLIHNSSNVGNYDDELDILDKYKEGPRYVIEGIRISYNKVLRNYSILRSYGIDPKKALHFAVCYNLVITKDEYDKLKTVLDELGGNQ